MSYGTGFAIYFVLWWVTLFAILPWGVRPQHEAGSVESGTDPGAPARPMLLKKLIWTTVVSGVIMAAMVWARKNGWSLLDLPIPGMPN
ncbi:DUF1467 family protein [Prosthecodimorpha staleyi]|uniref:DUF1467 family protein n=1 Tax=Prosthecodimorpha staleyi TaxID=2840188 RepID=A0A947GD28_9HYPH|nr:DUF1467 family protein [Prosthecodimorpha staleyi]MBT9287855.1 DUF1467 family protein [Prosthecodimorpha staleyi]